MILYNFIISKIKKVLINNNFTEIKPDFAGFVSIQKYFWQELSKINLEIINTKDIFQVCYLIKILDNIFDHELNLENYVLKINFLGCQNCVQDKNKLCKLCKKEFSELQDILQILSVNFIVDTKLNLDFENKKNNNNDNNKIVFEFSSTLESQIIFAIASSFNLNKLTASINLENLEALLQNNNNLNLPQAPVLNLIVPMSEKQQTLALLLANDLYFNNICTDILFCQDKQNIDDIMHKANKMGAKFVLVLSEQEQEENAVTIINVQTKQSSIVKQIETVKFLK
ncbi:hypothetical protein K9L05_01775 [Candidatus Babeliales bacterium]|nr:hypothetical protein [Candidatus Babeliales bacterium]MCF7899356.1 hypothetical protein [Candidatus Babeliales bacterium]